MGRGGKAFVLAKRYLVKYLGFLIIFKNKKYFQLQIKKYAFNAKEKDITSNFLSANIIVVGPVFMQNAFEWN